MGPAYVIAGFFLCHFGHGAAVHKVHIGNGGPRHHLPAGGDEAPFVGGGFGIVELAAQGCERYLHWAWMMKTQGLLPMVNPCSFFQEAIDRVLMNWSSQVMFAAMQSMVRGFRTESISARRESLR